MSPHGSLQSAVQSLEPVHGWTTADKADGVDTCVGGLPFTFGPIVSGTTVVGGSAAGVSAGVGAVGSAIGVVAVVAVVVVVVIVVVVV